MKNPGIGQILGPRYFGIGSLVLDVEDAKEQLRLGTAALLGKSTTVLTMYALNESFILEHTVIKDKIDVLPKEPSPIQTALRWNDDNEELALRVKFSASQQHGWSSLKLSCEYKIGK